MLDDKTIRNEVAAERNAASFSNIWESIQSFPTGEAGESEDADEDMEVEPEPEPEPDMDVDGSSVEYVNPDRNNAPQHRQQKERRNFPADDMEMDCQGEVPFQRKNRVIAKDIKKIDAGSLGRISMTAGNPPEKTKNRVHTSTQGSVETPTIIHPTQNLPRDSPYVAPPAPHQQENANEPNFLVALSPLPPPCESLDDLLYPNSQVMEQVRTQVGQMNGLAEMHENHHDISPTEEDMLRELGFEVLANNS